MQLAGVTELLLENLMAELEYLSAQVGHYVPESVYVPCKILLVTEMLHSNAYTISSSFCRRHADGCCSDAVNFAHFPCYQICS